MLIICQTFQQKLGYVAWCRDHGRALHGTMVYEQQETYSDLEPFTSYAYKLGLDDYTFQNCLWYSKKFLEGNSYVDSTSNDVGPGTVPDDALTYGRIIYGIVNPYLALPNNKNLLTLVNTDETSVHVLVNQKTGKYTIGPYQLQLNPEIRHINVDGDITQIGAEKLYQILTGKLNTKIKYVDFNPKKDITNLCGEGKKDYEILDEAGNVIKFPNFITGQKFYIRFTPDSEGRIDCTGFPEFKIHIMNKWTGETQAWGVVGDRVRVSNKGSQITVDNTRSNVEIISVTPDQTWSSTKGFTGTATIEVTDYVEYTNSSGSDQIEPVKGTFTIRVETDGGIEIPCDDYYDDDDCPNAGDHTEYLYSYYAHDNDGTYTEDVKDSDGNVTHKKGETIPCSHYHDKYRVWLHENDGYEPPTDPDDWDLAEQKTVQIQATGSWGSQVFQRVTLIINVQANFWNGDIPGGGDDNGDDSGNSTGWATLKSRFNMNKYFNIQLGGTVWLDGKDKLGKYDGEYERRRKS